MDKARKKELLQFYADNPPEMGVLMIRHRQRNECMIEAVAHLKSRINSSAMKLNTGWHPNKELQRAWSEDGEENFIIEIYEKLEYDKDKTNTDYSEELKVLEELCRERLEAQGMLVYGRSKPKNK